MSRAARRTRRTSRRRRRNIDEFYKKYSRWVGGFYARIEEARCYQELGDYEKTAMILDEVMAKPEYDEGFHRVRGAAAVLALQTALLPQVKHYKEAVEIYRFWEKNIARRAESTRGGFGHQVPRRRSRLGIRPQLESGHCPSRSSSAAISCNWPGICWPSPSAFPASIGSGRG